MFLRLSLDDGELHSLIAEDLVPKL